MEERLGICAYGDGRCLVPTPANGAASPVVEASDGGSHDIRGQVGKGKVVGPMGQTRGGHCDAVSTLF